MIRKIEDTGRVGKLIEHLHVQERGQALCACRPQPSAVSAVAARETRSLETDVSRSSLPRRSSLPCTAARHRFDDGMLALSHSVLHYKENWGTSCLRCPKDAHRDGERAIGRRHALVD
jgi:hypothetical protein